MQQRPAIDPVVWYPLPARARREGIVPESDTSLTVLRVPGHGPEDVVVTPEGDILTGVDDGRILRIRADGHVTTVANTGGRPLGLELFADGRILVCDAERGLLCVAPEGGVVTCLVNNVHGAPLRFCNNAAIARDGTIYFSASSQRFGLAHWRADIMEHGNTGRLLRRTPDGNVEVLLTGLSFANGVALAPDESFVTVAETGSYRVRKLWLTGPNVGRDEPFIDQLGGFPDNSSTGSDGLIWVTQASPRNRLLDFLHTQHPALRRWAWALPEALQPGPVPVVWVLGIAADGRVVHDIALTSPDLHMVTGVREHHGTLYLGSLEGNAIGKLTWLRSHAEPRNATRMDATA